MDPMRVFIGFDKRQPLAYNVARSSVERHAKSRVQVEPVRIDWLPIKRVGLTEFTYSRFLVPWLCDYKGVALFMDSDTIAQGDVTELLDVITSSVAVSVVKGPKRFEWPSVMVFQCSNCDCGRLNPRFVENPDNALFDFAWTRYIGSLPDEWNNLIGYQKPNPKAKIIHYTAGIPIWTETKNSPLARLWWHEAEMEMDTVSWEELMGKSVHRKVVEAMNAR